MKDSAYTLAVRDPAGRRAYFNTRSGTLRLMSAAEFDACQAAVSGRAPLATAAPLLAALATDGFLIDDGEDEFAAIQAAHHAARTSRETLHLVIAPSLACNLACPYCFEADKAHRVMPAAVDDRLAALVCEAAANGTRRLAVTWYGGEPLIAWRALQRLSERCIALAAELGLAYSADIVTNGTLLTPERARRLAGLGVTRAQISLDGPPDIHDRRRTSKSGEPTFASTLDAIIAAAATMQVAVRINACREVAERIEEVLSLLAARGLNRCVSAYVAPLRALPPGVGRPQPAPVEQGSRRPIVPLHPREAAELAFRFDDLARRYGFPTHPTGLPEPRGHACIADHDQSWLIEPGGTVQKCDWTIGIGEEAVGRLGFDGIALDQSFARWRDHSVFDHPRCAACQMLPLCLGSCPLRLMQGEDCCIPFKQGWPRTVARAAGLQPERIEVIPAALAGEQLHGVTAEGLSGAVPARRPRFLLGRWRG
jgi:uncharacterized protein